MWASTHAELEGKVLVIEVRGEHFDDDAGVVTANSLDDMLEVLGTTVTQIITCHSGDHNVFELHALAGFSDTLGFVRFEGIRACCFYGTETTCTSALFTSDHEGGSAVTPALPAIWALSFLADGDQVEVSDQGLGRPEFGVIGKTHFDPVRLALGVECRIHVHPRAVTVHEVLVTTLLQVSSLKFVRSRNVELKGRY